MPMTLNPYRSSLPTVWGTVEAPTGELGIGELQPTEEPSHHHHQHGPRQCLSLFCWTTAQRPLKCHEVVVDISQIREANQSTYKLACLLVSYPMYVYVVRSGQFTRTWADFSLARQTLGKGGSGNSQTRSMYDDVCTFFY